MANWMQHGPPRAQVVSIEITEEPPEGEHAFIVT
jgi:hypothetical protein